MSLPPGDAGNEALLRKAVYAGINFFDTADLYDRGANEEVVGRALKPVRDQVVIATKVGNQWRPDGSGWDWNPGKAYILRAVDDSLRRLQTDYIDLYQLHGGTMEDPIDEAIEAFEQLKATGKIRAYGISSIRPPVIRTWLDRSNMDTLMTPYSVLDRRPEAEIMGWLQPQKVSMLARGVLAQGMLVNKPVKEYVGKSVDEVQKIVETFRRQTGDPVSNALAFALDQKVVASAVVGVRTEEQLDMIGHW
jgi:aryl-alcohol dehydrogenase-like predicted oxidoreductase